MENVDSRRRILRVGLLLVAWAVVLLACGREGFTPQETACEGVDCSGHGVCAVVGGEAVCVCEPGWRSQGADCVEESVENPCVGVTCSGYGTCAVREGEAYCVCEEGFHAPPGDPADCVADEVPCSGADGTPCDDGQFCTAGDVCIDGRCTGTTSPCDDGNPCTVDLCNELDDACTNTPKPDGAACEDGAFCTIGEICTAGQCGGGMARSCADGNPCTADTCDEQQDLCLNNDQPDGTSCDEGSYCTTGAVCQQGICIGGQPRDCDDDNTCTTDVCDEVLERCEHVPIEDGTACDDGKFCTLDDVCSAGLCQGTPNSCADDNACTLDQCNEQEDSCDNDPMPDGTACEDGNFCTIGEICTAGQCGGGMARSCADGNACTADACDEELDRCVNSDQPDGSACEDGSYCTTGEVCQDGVCGGGQPRDCDDANVCTTDVCNEGLQRCDHVPVTDGTVCDDGQFCTLDDACSAGVCRGAPNPCADGNPCTADNCDEMNDTCVWVPVTDGTSCDDGQFCTLGETCTGGVCSGGNPRNCSDGNPCTQDVCDDGADACDNSPVNEGAACDDGAFCTLGETCIGGVCGGGTLRDCSDDDVCSMDLCDEANDVCVHDAAAANGTPCDDGLYCTVTDTCSNGTCTGGVPRNCGDGDPCTVDSCDDTADSCVHDAAAADGLACDDGGFCTVSDVCNGGVCTGGVPRDCSDGNPCTADSCDETGDVCVNDAAAANGNACNDGSYCTVGETCSGGVCTGGTARDCSDSDPCTADSCNEVDDACDNSPVADGTACNDGLYCTIGETCTAGACSGGAARDCSDGNQCTADTCDDTADNCVHTDVADGTACDDGQFCITGENCTAGVCGGGAPRDCSDGNQCTLDSCDESADACDNDAAAMDGAGCDDGNFCMVGEVCTGGGCGGGSLRLCDDGNQCTLDSCDESGDACVNDTAAADGNTCEDGLFCTAGDSCSGGVCQAGSSDPCTTGNPCAASCDEVNDTCGGCVPAGTVCASPTQEATCDGACNVSQLVICSYGCNFTRDECNQCEPSTVECKGDAELLCNAEFVCDADGLLVSTTCCSTNRCTCGGGMCLEDLCAAAPDLSGGGTLSGDTCDDDDHIPGDCNPGGTACQSVASGGTPEEMFQFTLDDGTSGSAFYTVDLDSTGSSLDTSLRVSTVCGNENRQVSYARTCAATPGTVPLEACSESSGAEVLKLCGMPEDIYFGAVDGALGTCGTYDLGVTITPVSLDTGAEAGNVSSGGTFLGNTCGLTDDYTFPDTLLWSGSPCGDCVGNNPTDCPNCGVLAANDCTLGVNSTDDKCTYSGAGSPDAVFYLAIEVDSGVDISTDGSGFDTVLYLMQTGPDGADPPGVTRVCNDDCWESDGPSHIQTSLNAGLYYVFLDGAGGACGDYVLKVVVSPASNCGNLVCEDPYEDCASCPQDCTCPNCGDGVIQAYEGEQCDDGGTGGGDCCSGVCVIEPGCACYGEPSTCGTPFAVDGSSSPGMALEDCNTSPPGSRCDETNYGTTTDTISIGTACTIVDINVDMDISHTYKSDLTVELTSPGGTTVFLHNESGGSDDDIVGNYDLTLPVDGPGSLEDFEGEAGNGTWTLTIHDWYSSDSGTLNSWAVHLSCL